MKRLNRNKIIVTLEIARQGYASAIGYALDREDILYAKAFDAHHRSLNKMIVELGGEDVNDTLLDFYNKTGGK